MAKKSWVFICFSAIAFSDPSLIREVESLRNGLPMKDPSRQPLTLRLADLLFDEASEVFKNPQPTENDIVKANKYRREAIELYKEALTGGPGQYAPANGDLAWKLRFQLARLYSDLADNGRAIPLWKEVYGQNDLKEIKREASLRLAELAEAGKLPTSSAYDYYRTALELCSGSDVCSYVHYKKAWLLHNQGKNSDAVTEMSLALWDSKGQIREESLRDYLLFLSQEPGNGEKGILLVEPLAEKLHRPKLFVELMDEYFSAGNKVAGVTLLEYVHAHDPQIKYQVRLLEETYGVRNWDRFHYHLDRIQELKLANLDAQEIKDVEKVLRRLLIQLDGERVTKKDTANDFKTATLLYLKLFPKSPERFKMQEGWLAAETTPEKKISQLKIWIEDPNTSLVEQIKLREHRVSVAQKLNNEDIVVEEMRALSQLAPQSPADAKKAREYEYLLARALYAKKDFASALPLFEKLSKYEGTPDTWAIRSQNLVLDIYNQQKNYPALLAQADSWLNSPLKDSKSAEIKKELADMTQVKRQATFEWATSLGKDPKALSIFFDFCQKKEFLPKSCENSKILAVHLKDQKTLIAVLQILNLEKELTAEYEASGFFGKAAINLEKNLKGSKDFKDSLKVALFYELADQANDQKRILKSMVTSLYGKKLEPKEEELLYSTLREAGLIEPNLLKISWSEGLKARLASDLENKGFKSKETQKILMAYPYQVGPAWAKYVMEELKGYSVKQSKLGFYGKKAEKKFNARIEAIKAFSAQAEKYLPGCEPKFRSEVLALLEKDYNDLTNEIINSPIPKGLDEESVGQIKKSLEEMAKPFKEKAVAYQGLKEAEEKKVAAVTETKASVAAMPKDVHEMALQTLHENPTETGALKNLKAYYQSQGQNRLAAYFEGRIEQLQSGKEDKKL